jgi:light-regulated signal transduction histidine kinase (bacteriophytochrome)/CheY-like chemotaxis protein
VPDAATVDLTNCDREPIHIPGSIQPHGCLLVCDSEAATILRHSANAPALLHDEGDLNGRTLETVLGAGETHALRNALAGAANPARPALLFARSLRSGIFDIAVHRHLSTVIVEIEPAGEPSSQPLEVARSLIGRMVDIPTVERLVRDSTRLVKAMLGYDRVMIYRFEHDGSGKVVAEAKRADLESFLGQYFPPTDIPQQARLLYLKNTTRIISNAQGTRVPLIPVLDASGEPVDLSFAHLRSVSPIHCEYLTNMGVSASMSVSIIVGGRLWGLIACHHYAPRVLTMAQRVAAEMFGEFFSLHLDALRQRGTLEVVTRARRTLDGFLRLASHQTDLRQVLHDNLPDFQGLMACDGVGLWMEGRYSASGIAPPASEAPALARFVAGIAASRVWATHALGRHYPAAESFADQAAGILAVPLSQRPRDYLLFFRRELTQTLDWAGNPDKTYSTGPLGDRLTPRKSFAIWKETVHGQSEPWSDSDREIAEATRGALVEIVLRHNELMADERVKSDVRQRMLNEELNHRVKNILAIIQSLVGHPPQAGHDILDYAASLKGRIQALALAHDQIARGDGGGALLDLLNAELTPYRGAETRIALAGPNVWLDARAFSVMALVLHELITNAAKYGSLSVAHGRLEVEWRITDDAACDIGWRESGGPRVKPPSREGFGSVLINRSIPFDLGGDSAIDYAPAGIRARFRIPSAYVSLVAQSRPAEAEAAGAIAARAESRTALAGLDLLLVEDQMLIAMDVEAMLAEKGLDKVTTAASADEALVRLKNFAPDAAILDVNLGIATSLPVAEELRRRDIPFVFATGYGDSSVIPAELSDAPVVRKPYDADSLVDALALALGRHRSRG